MAGLVATKPQETVREPCTPLTRGALGRSGRSGSSLMRTLTVMVWRRQSPQPWFIRLLQYFSAPDGVFLFLGPPTSHASTDSG